MAAAIVIVERVCGICGADVYTQGVEFIEDYIEGASQKRYSACDKCIASLMAISGTEGA